VMSSAHPVQQSQKQTPSGGSDELREVSEGAACVRVVADASPGEMGGYYSEKMRLNRDLLVLGVAAHLVAMSSRMKKARTPGGDPVRVLDAFAASGLAGIRVVLEAPALAEALEKKRQREEEIELEGGRGRRRLRDWKPRFREDSSRSREVLVLPPL
jgi:hypothetical protein